MDEPLTRENEATTTALEAETGEQCGFSYDHDPAVTFEDGTARQWVCVRCGAEGEDALEPAS
ncbi:hypothetical protein [Curtobacterium sp. 20TX0008]|uniref:hypothetical protein n=1 Tax=Curtobacterium sp. 20TX0008 TaxID=3022018 RepID=UPI0023312738|nr:hypothetical protein [Curtobacterium sp. 20TX0008]MDB6425904.1 hypothetical protein [Curtobacterium sp. 20TX0008]